MTHQEAGKRYMELRRKWKAGKITPVTYRKSVARLQVKGPGNAVWQIHADRGVWQVWDGRSWTDKAPPPSGPKPGAKKGKKPPETLAELFAFLLKRMLIGLAWQIPIGIVVFILVWLFHSFVLIFVNEGFNAGSGGAFFSSFFQRMGIRLPPIAVNFFTSIVDGIIATKGKGTLTGPLFWMLLMSLLMGNLMRGLKKGPVKFFGNFFGTPGWVAKTLKSNVSVSKKMGFLLGGLTSGLFLSVVIGAKSFLFVPLLGSRPLVFLMALHGFDAIIWRLGTFTMLVTKITWSDAQRALRKGSKPKPLNTSCVLMTHIGLSVGLLCGAVVPFVSVCGCAGFLLMLLATLGVVLLPLMGQKGTAQARGASTILIFLTASLLLMSTSVFADDFGWQESGGSFSGLANSPGGATAAALGGLAGGAAVAGVAIGGAATSVATGAAAGGGGFGGDDAGTGDGSSAGWDGEGPEPTGYFGNGDPYWGDGSPDNPYTDQPPGPDLDIPGDAGDGPPDGVPDENEPTAQIPPDGDEPSTGDGGDDTGGNDAGEGDDQTGEGGDDSGDGSEDEDSDDDDSGDDDSGDDDSDDDDSDDDSGDDDSDDDDSDDDDSDDDDSDDDDSDDDDSDDDDSDDDDSDDDDSDDDDSDDDDSDDDDSDDDDEGDDKGSKAGGAAAGGAAGSEGGDSGDDTSQADKDKEAREQKEREERERKEREERERKEREERERREKEERERKAREEREKRRKELEERQKKLQEEAEKANKSAWWWDVGTKSVEVVQVVADKSIDVLATVTGPAGQRVKDVYTVVKGTAGGLGQAHADGTSYVKGALKGTGNGLVDLGIGKALDKINGFDKGPGFRDYKPGVDWSGARTGFVKNALSGKGVDGAVSDMVRDRFTTGAKNAAQSHIQTKIVKKGGGGILGWMGF